jgi:hypothetical protein
MSIVFTAREGRDKLVAFRSSHLILVEGSDDRAVIANLIGHEGVPGDNFHIHNMVGNRGWPEALKGFMQTAGFEDVLSLGLIRDADTNPAGTWQSCRDALANAGLPVPSAPDQLQNGRPAVAVTLVPSSTGIGALEELCWMSFDPELCTCVDSYFQCTGNIEAVKKKEQVQVYLAGLRRPCPNLAIAADRRTLDFSNSAFDTLRNFVRMLASEGPEAVVDS